MLNLSPDELAKLAGESPPGARGVVAVPWLDGARAPWWRDTARAGFVGLSAGHEVGDLGRAGGEWGAGEAARRPLAGECASTRVDLTTVAEPAEAEVG